MIEIALDFSSRFSFYIFDNQCNLTVFSSTSVFD